MQNPCLLAVEIQSKIPNLLFHWQYVQLFTTGENLQSKINTVGIYTVKPAQAVTSIKQSPVLKDHL
jgi:hypothetical protein